MEKIQLPNNAHRFSYTQKTQTGMSLVEVLVALVVVSVALIGLIEGMNSYAQYYIQLREKYWSSNLAWDELSVLHIAQEAGKLKKITQSGTIEQLTSSWEWQMDIQPTSSPTIKLVQLSVELPNGEGKTTLTTMIMDGSGFSRDTLKAGDVRR